MNDLAQNISRIAAIITSGKPNQGELKQRENLLKKSMGKFAVSDLLVFQSKCSLIELVLTLQFVERCIKSRGGIGQTSQEDLWVVLTEFLSSVSVDPLVRRHAIVVACVVLVKCTRPASLVTFLKDGLQSVPEMVKVRILSELPSLSGLREDDEKIIQNWSSEVWPLITHNSELMEIWAPFTSGATVASCPDLFSKSGELEEILVALARKPEVVTQVLKVVEDTLLPNGEFVKASRVFGEICIADQHHLAKAINILAEFKTVISQNPSNLSLADRMKIIENVFGFFENRNTVILNMEVLEALIVLSAFPRNVPVVVRQDLEDEDSPDGLRRRFLEVRQEVRHILRVMTVDSLQEVIGLVSRSFSLGDWRITESVLHAFSAQQKRFGQVGGRIIASLIKLCPLDQRCVANALIICATTYFQSFPKEDMNSLMTFAINCLATIDTEEPTGWFPFRAKQDHSCVVLLQSIAASNQPIDLESFLGHLLSQIDKVKQRLYFTDPFRQSRDLFVKAVTEIVIKSSASPGPLLVQLVPILCVDCEDISIVITQADRVRESLFPLIEDKLETFLRTNACGVESIISVYSDRFSVDQLMACFYLSLRSSGFSPQRWLAVVSQLSRTHGVDVVSRFSSIIDTWPLRIIPPEWFSVCLPLVPVHGPGADLHALWVNRVSTELLSQDQFEVATQYAVAVITSDRVGTFVIRMMTAVSTVSSAHAVDALVRLGIRIGWPTFIHILQSTVPKSGTEAKLLGEALRQNELGKAKRIMKKISNGFTN